MIKTELQSNNLDLRALLDAINNLPEKGSGGTGEDISEELTAQDALISEISLALDEVAIAQAEAFAAIGVTYPEGSTCTCSNGTKTLTAKDTSGQALFLIPEAGEWTVTSTANDDSGNSKSETVEITIEGQSESVDLVELVLFDSGNQCEDITGGWGVINGSNSNASIGDDSIYVRGAGASSYGHIAATINKVKVDGYKTLKASVNVTGAGHIFGVSNTRERLGNTFVASVTTSTLGFDTLELPMENVVGTYYILFQGEKAEMTVFRVWLE